MGNCHSNRHAHKASRQDKAVLPTVHILSYPTDSHSEKGFAKEESRPESVKPLRIVRSRSFLSPSLRSLSYFSAPPKPLAYSPQVSPVNSNALPAYTRFLKQFPEYRLTWTLDSLRQSDFIRHDRTGETYVDYMGGALFPESLVRAHADFLSQSVLGNTHSTSNSSKSSSICAAEARSAVLSFFHASASDYTVIFTSNASGALKLVAESFPFGPDSSYVLSADSHNSVNGIRQYALREGSNVEYIPAMSTGGIDSAVAKEILISSKPADSAVSPSLFALTGQSNISNSKSPLSLLEYASSLGYYTLLDAAALAPTSVISLQEHPVDAMAISFYKMFGYPTGVGALVVKKTFLQKLKRPWFAGGNVDVVQVPGTIVTPATELHEQFEDGTINYTALSAVTDGLQFLSAFLPFLPLRLSCLLHFLVSSLNSLRHDASGTPVVKILSRLPTYHVKSVGGQSDSGSLVSLLLLLPSGEIMPNSFVEHAASRHNISLRTGCMCNPGGAAALLGIEHDMEKLYDGVTLKDFERQVGHDLGVVRISLGLASNFDDVWTVVKFIAGFGQERTREARWTDYMAARNEAL